MRADPVGGAVWAIVPSLLTFVVPVAATWPAVVVEHVDDCGPAGAHSLDVWFRDQWRVCLVGDDAMVCLVPFLRLPGLPVRPSRSPARS